MYNLNRSVQSFLDHRIEFVVMSHSTIHEEFLCRLDELERKSPAIFNTVKPIELSPSGLFKDKVENILGKIPSGAGKSHDGLNEQLYNRLQRLSLANAEKPQVNLVAVVEGKNSENKKKGKKSKAGGMPTDPKAPKDLPILAYRDEILEKVAKNQVVLIRGATGCGKTTQVPQFILDSFIKAKQGTKCRILCTQPRRVAAISIATRIAAERCETLGRGGSVGFLIRCENEMPRKQGGSILLCTTGVLLRQLENDPTFAQITHIIVDEVHERSTESDVVLAALKYLLPFRPDLRVIIMSATIEADQFSKYFDNCPTLDIPGFNHTVEEVYLSQIERMINMPLQYPVGVDSAAKKRIINAFAVKLIEHIHTQKPPGAILVFLPGYEDLVTLFRSLKKKGDKTMKICVLHSLVQVRKHLIFEKVEAPLRKIVLSTNVAESSITINDVVYVIDTGKVKAMSYIPKSSNFTLQTQCISKANAIQRKGRAGRCQDGIVYRMYNV